MFLLPAKVTGPPGSSGLTPPTAPIDNLQLFLPTVPTLRPRPALRTNKDSKPHSQPFFPSRSHFSPSRLPARPTVTLRGHFQVSKPSLPAASTDRAVGERPLPETSIPTPPPPPAACGHSSSPQASRWALAHPAPRLPAALLLRAPSQPVLLFQSTLPHPPPRPEGTLLSPCRPVIPALARGPAWKEVHGRRSLSE